MALAKFVLENMPEWSEKRIVDATGAGVSSAVRLAEPLPVRIAYGTARVKNGRIHFFDDIDGLDRQLYAALQQRRGVTSTMNRTK